MILGDYLTLMLLNMAAGLWMVAAFLQWGIQSADRRLWCPGFAIVGLIALASGLHMTFAWPMPGQFAFANVAFGEMTALFGAAYLGAALAVGLRWPLHSIAIYTFISGMAAVVVGIRIQTLGVTMYPVVTMAGFVATGLVGMLLLPTVGNPGSAALRGFSALLSAGSGALWLAMGLMSYWMHVAGAAAGHFMKW